MLDTLNIDKKHIWHPYDSLPSKSDILAVKSTNGCTITLEDGRELTDAMSSWWSAIHGYNHPTLNQAIKGQVDSMSHIMFGGLTHAPAARLARLLVDITPKSLESVFFADSGSVGVEVALKCALLYAKANKQKEKTKFISFENSYHGDTLGAMSVCDRENSMHNLYTDYLPSNVIQSPSPNSKNAIEEFENILKTNHQQTAAVILEPIVQGAGGMKIYKPSFLKKVRELCTQYNTLLILDEIATGFGHTGKMFACEWSDIEPDIMIVGKALTGGYLSLSAMLCTKKISDTISSNPPFALMHGPTFMANPLACAVSTASIELLLNTNWQEKVQNIENHFSKELQSFEQFKVVKEVRNIGAIGVIELKSDQYAKKIQNLCVQNGVWIRPFGNLVYAITAYTITNQELHKITNTIYKAIKEIENG